jgi:hypothetical protein
MMHTRLKFQLAILCYVGIFASVLGCVEADDTQDWSADSERAAVQIIARLYRGGPILTMAGESPESRFSSIPRRSIRSRCARRSRAGDGTLTFTPLRAQPGLA